MIFVIIYCTIFLFLFFSLKMRIIPYLPLFVTIVEVLPFYLGLNNSNIILLSYLNTIIFFSIYLIFILINRREFFSIKAVKFIILFISLMLIAISNSSDRYYSFKLVMNFSTVLLTFPITYVFFRMERIEPNKFFNILLFCLVIYILNISICSVFRIGDAIYSYSKNSFIYFGGVNFFNLYPVCYSFVVCLLFFSKKKYSRYVISLLTLVFLFLVFVIGKRTYLYISLLGVLAMFYNSKSTLFISVFVGLLILSITPAIVEVIDNQFFKSRGSAITRNINEEGRFIEFAVYKDEIINNGNIVEILFGKEIFNSRAKFFQSNSLLKDTDRVLHSDYSNILYGVGIIGISTYLLILVFLYIEIRSIKIINNKNFGNKFRFIYFIVLAILFLNGFTDGILSFPNRFFPFFILGAIIGLFRNEIKTI